MLKNGKPLTYCGQGHYDSELMDSLPKREQVIVLCWIDKYLCCDRSYSDYYISYGLKHILERDTGIYLTNNQFKDAMLISGYEHTKESEDRINWEYPLYKRSAALLSKRDGDRPITEEDIEHYIFKHPEYRE